MRAADAMQESLFTVAKLDDFVPEDHPPRGVRLLVNAALTEMNARSNEIYASSGRDSIAPEKLIQAWTSQKSFRPKDRAHAGRTRRTARLPAPFSGVA